MVLTINFNFKEIKNLIYLLIYGIIALLIICHTKRPELHIVLIWGMAILAVVICKLQIVHPYFWFSISFSLYSTAYTILYVMGFGIYGYDSENLFLSTLSLLTSLLVIGSKRVDINSFPKNKIHIPSETLEIIITFLSLLCLFCTILLSQKGYSGKVEMKKAQDFNYRIATYLSRFICTFLMIYFCEYLSSKKYRSKFKNLIIVILNSGISIIYFTLITGERDATLRFLLLFFMSLFVYNKLKSYHALILLPFGIWIMVFSVYIKYFFSRGILNNSYLSFNNIISNFLQTDFHSSGMNLQYLLENSWTESSQGIQLLFAEMLTPFLPSGIIFNPDQWFNYVVHSGKYHGYAFSLVGTGYIIGGRIGVVLLFFIVGLMCRHLYKNSIKDVYNMVSYICMISAFIASFRSSAGSIYTSYVRTILIPIIFCKFIIPDIRFISGKLL